LHVANERGRAHWGAACDLLVILPLSPGKHALRVRAFHCEANDGKGQEWKSLFVLNVVDGCMPSDLGTGTSAEIEEERRLLYVAMTRAKDDLHLIVPQRFFTHGQRSQGDRHVYASRTRFIPDRLLGLFEKTVWPLAVAGATARAASQGPRIDVGARMRGMWR
jgi:DNA helicase-2/ATP-dependent DNA helicase PcrA